MGAWSWCRLACACLWLGRLAAFAGATAFAGSPAAAQASPAAGEEPKRAAALNWLRAPGAEGCADATTLARAVEARLGRSVFVAPSSALLNIEGRAEHGEGGYRAELHVFDEHGAELGSREVQSSQASCEELSQAVSVVLAVMVDPDGALAPQPAPSAPIVQAAAPPVLLPEAKAAPCPVCEWPRRRRVLSSGVLAFARVALGQLPRAAPGFGLGWELTVADWLGVRIEGVGFLEQRAHMGAQPSAGAQLRVLYGGLELCPLWRGAGAFRLGLCAGAELGALQSRSFGLSGAARDANDFLAQAAGMARVSYRFAQHVALHAAAGMLVPITRTLYEAALASGERATLFQTRAVGGQFDLGIGGYF
jgi:hypothetical protein